MCDFVGYKYAALQRRLKRSNRIKRDFKLSEPHKLYKFSVNVRKKDRAVVTSGALTKGLLKQWMPLGVLNSNRREDFYPDVHAQGELSSRLETSIQLMSMNHPDLMHIKATATPTKSFAKSFGISGIFADEIEVFWDVQLEFIARGGSKLGKKAFPAVMLPFKRGMT